MLPFKSQKDHDKNKRELSTLTQTQLASLTETTPKGDATVAWIYLLASRLGNAREEAETLEALESVSAVAAELDPTQIRFAAKEFTGLLKAIADASLKESQAPIKALLLFELTMVSDPKPRVLTPAHLYLAAALTKSERRLADPLLQSFTHFEGSFGPKQLLDFYTKTTWLLAEWKLWDLAALFAKCAAAVAPPDSLPRHLPLATVLHLIATRRPGTILPQYLQESLDGSAAGYAGGYVDDADADLENLDLEGDDGGEDEYEDLDGDEYEDLDGDEELDGGEYEDLDGDEGYEDLDGLDQGPGEDLNEDLNEDLEGPDEGPGDDLGPGEDLGEDLGPGDGMEGPDAYGPDEEYTSAYGPDAYGPDAYGSDEEDPGEEDPGEEDPGEEDPDEEDPDEEDPNAYADAKNSDTKSPDAERGAAPPVLMAPNLEMLLQQFANVATLEFEKDFADLAETTCKGYGLQHLCAPLVDAYRIAWLEALHRVMPRCQRAHLEECGQFDIGLLYRGYNATVSLCGGEQVFEYSPPKQDPWDTLENVVAVTRQLKKKPRKQPRRGKPADTH